MLEQEQMGLDQNKLSLRRCFLEDVVKGKSDFVNWRRFAHFRELSLGNRLKIEKTFVLPLMRLFLALSQTIYYTKLHSCSPHKAEILEQIYN